MSAAARFRIGSWTATPALNQLDNGERSLKLEPRTMDVLAYLAAHAGDVVSVEELLSAVWRSVIVSDSSVYNAIKQLRQALAGSGEDSRYIETIPKRGYRLVAPVERLLPAASGAADAGMPMLAEQPPERLRPAEPPPSSRRPWGLASAAIALGLLLGAAIGAAWMRSTQNAARASEVIAGRTFRFSIPIEGFFGGLAISSDGRYLAYSVDSTPETALLHVRPLDALESRPIAGTAGALHPFWSPDAQQLGFLAGGRIQRIALAGGPPHDLAATPVGTIGSWSADVILFDGSTGIERVSAVGGESVNVTTLDKARGEVAHTMPSFLPDGRRFFFATAFGAAGTFVGSLGDEGVTQVLPFSATAIYAAGKLFYNRGRALFVQDFDLETLALSGEAIRLTDELATDQSGVFGAFSVSAAGVLAYATGDLLTFGPSPRPTQLAWYDRDGTRLESVGEPGLYRGIALSPDGTRVVVHRHENPDGGNLWLRDLDRGTFTRLTLGAAHDLWPTWSPDGDFVLFTGTNVHLHRKRGDGVGDEELILTSVRAAHATSWAADGSVLFTHVPANDADVAALRVDGERESVPLLSSEFNELDAVVSPNGLRVAYVSDESGHLEVYVRSYPELQRKLQVSTHGGTYPRWAHDGSELFYLTENGALMSAPLDADGRVLAPRELFQSDVATDDHWTALGQLPHRPYDVAPDGRFLINERTAPGAGDFAPSARNTIVVVLNWAAALER